MEEVRTEIRNVSKAINADLKRIADKLNSKINTIILMLIVFMALILTLDFFGK